MRPRSDQNFFPLGILDPDPDPPYILGLQPMYIVQGLQTQCTMYNSRYDSKGKFLIVPSC